MVLRKITETSEILGNSFISIFLIITNNYELNKGLSHVTIFIQM